MGPPGYLEIYLDDHRAGAAGGSRLARRIYRNNAAGPWAGELEELSRRIDRDKRTLKEVREALGMDGGMLKTVSAVAAERIARLKFNGHLLGYSPLSRVLEVESLMSGVLAKRRLWAALHVAQPSYPELERFDFEGLGTEAESQLEVLGRVHGWATGLAFEAE
ncbi:MAG TPA: hypothetical protein VK088_02085 [Acidimicrobiia bacterium]|nr:hypothetical protein [Acidimicrobiia bacterium]